MQQNFEQIYH